MVRIPSDKEANAPVLQIDPVFGEMAVAMGQATCLSPSLPGGKRRLPA